MREQAIAAMARAIRAEIVKGWDFPLSTTPESQSEAGAAAALDALLSILPTPDMCESSGDYLWGPTWRDGMDEFQLALSRDTMRGVIAAALSTLADKGDRSE